MNATTTHEQAANTAALEMALEPRADQLPTVIPVAAIAPTSAGVTPADLLRIAMESGDKDIDRLERLMAMDERYRQAQERDRQRDAMLAFESAFADFRGENVIIPKTKDVDRGKAGTFAHAEFDEVCRRLSPALSKHGFGFRHKQRFGTRPRVIDGVEEEVPWVWVTCILSHRNGHSDISELDGPPANESANSPIQNMQCSASVLKRQTLLAITGTATGGEDDESKQKRLQSAADAATAAVGSLEANKTAGHAEAGKGMAALTAWWSTLTPLQQRQLSADFGAMRKTARAVDGEATR